MNKFIIGIVFVLLTAIAVVIVSDYQDSHAKLKDGSRFYSVGMYEQAFKSWDGLEKYRWDVAQKFSRVYFLGLMGKKNPKKAKQYLFKFLDQHKADVGHLMALILIEEDVIKNQEKIEMLLKSSLINDKESEFLLAIHFIAFDKMDEFRKMLEKGFYGDALFQHEKNESGQRKDMIYKGIQEAYLGLNTKIMLTIGKSFLSEKLLGKNINFAYYWFDRAAQLGNLDAAYLMYVINKNGQIDRVPRNVIPKNCSLSNKYLGKLNNKNYFEYQDKNRFQGYCENK